MGDRGRIKNIETKLYRFSEVIKDLVEAKIQET